ncbi:MAG: transposase [Deltaproteobacteria bacterium]|nr:transposase [Deltaproteobacteria bacterium]
MARPLRIEYPGALYHITSRGNARARIFADDIDRKIFLRILGFVLKRFNWLCHAYCLMGDHYHLLVETPDANLSRGMRQLNGLYTQRFNWRHHKSGHLLQGRYKAILVDKDEYLLELARYMMLNPVRAGMVDFPEGYAWSSYRATVGKIGTPELLTPDWLLAQFGEERRIAQRRFADFVRAGTNLKKSPWEDLKGQIYLGDDDFVESISKHISGIGSLREVPRKQRFASRVALSWLFMGEAKTDRQKRNRAIYAAHVEQGYRLQEIGDFLDMHYASISRIVVQVEKEMLKYKT